MASTMRKLGGFIIASLTRPHACGGHHPLPQSTTSQMACMAHGLCQASLLQQREKAGCAGVSPIRIPH